MSLCVCAAGERTVTTPPCLVQPIAMHELESLPTVGQSRWNTYMYTIYVYVCCACLSLWWTCVGGGPVWVVEL